MSRYDIVDRHLAPHVLPPALRPAGSVAASHAFGQRSAADGVSCRLGDSSCAAAHARHLGRCAGARHTSLHRSLLELQRDYGNRYVGQVLGRAGGPADGERSPDAIERSIDSARGSGQGLDHVTRSRMESSFGADFTGVRIHTDARADGLNESLGARAFATGQDVFFRHGEYNPGSTAGRELLAHELTHVVQQNGDAVRAKLTVSEPGDAQEQEADRVAQAVMQQEQHPQRQPEAPKEDEDSEKGKLGRRLDRATPEEDEVKPE